jgi:hypothetical protein
MYRQACPEFQLLLIKFVVYSEVIKCENLLDKDSYVQFDVLLVVQSTDVVPFLFQGH